MESAAAAISGAARMAAIDQLTPSTRYRDYFPVFCYIFAPDEVRTALALPPIRHQIGTFSRSDRHRFPIRSTPLEVPKNTRYLTIFSSCKAARRTSGNDREWGSGYEGALRLVDAGAAAGHQRTRG